MHRLPPCVASPPSITSIPPPQGAMTYRAAHCLPPCTGTPDTPMHCIPPCRICPRLAPSTGYPHGTAPEHRFPHPFPCTLPGDGASRAFSPARLYRVRAIPQSSTALPCTLPGVVVIMFATRPARYCHYILPRLRHPVPCHYIFPLFVIIFYPGRKTLPAPVCCHCIYPHCRRFVVIMFAPSWSILLSLYLTPSTLSLHLPLSLCLTLYMDGCCHYVSPLFLFSLSL